MGSGVTLIDSGEETARVTCRMLADDGLLHSRASLPSSAKGSHRFFVSDIPEKFSQLATRFLGKTPETITRVNVSGY